MTNFNYTLTPNFWNETGNGTLCADRLPLPPGLTPSDGQRASLQVVTFGKSGSALYNCADITFRTAVSAYGGQSCTTDPGVSYYVVNQQSANGTVVEGNSGNSTGSSGGGGSGKSAASINSANLMALTLCIGLALALFGPPNRFLG